MSSENLQNHFKVSVVVPIYNGEQDIPGLIDCLVKQTYSPELTQYILVDNNSKDATGELLSSKAEDLKSQGFTILVLAENEIQSSYAARNKGIKNATGEIIAFTDADCRPQPDWLSQLVAPFSKENVGIVAGEIVALPGKSLLEKYAERQELMSQKFLLDHPFCPYGQTANLAIRTEIFTKIGLFRPYLTTGGDADICWRIQKETHWQLEYAPEAIISHRHRSSWQEFKRQWQRYGRSNRYLHQLHGVDLMRELKPSEIIYRLSRWLLKELPKNTYLLVNKKSLPIDLIKTPIDLVGFQARFTGQKEASLPELAKQIEWLESSEKPNNHSSNRE